MLHDALDAGVDPSACGNLALRLARDADVVALLLADPRVNPSVDDDTVLKHACLTGNADIVRLVIVHASDSARSAALRLAQDSHRPDVVAIFR